MSQNKTLALLVYLLLSNSAFAEKKHEHHNHAAHVHGAATLAIAFEGTSGKIEFKGAADGVLGFEFEAKTAKDKKTLSDTIETFEKDISSMVQFDSNLNCTLKSEKIAQEKKGKEKHSDFIANYTVTCAKEILNSKITFDFTKFKKLQDLDITLLAGPVQKNVEYKGKVLSLEIK